MPANSSLEAITCKDISWHYKNIFKKKIQESNSSSNNLLFIVIWRKKYTAITNN
jgi:hypothetical protein